MHHFFDKKAVELTSRAFRDELEQVLNLLGSRGVFVEATMSRGLVERGEDGAHREVTDGVSLRGRQPMVMI